MPFVSVRWWKGKTQEQREKVAKAITDAIVSTLREAGFNIWPETVWVVFDEVERENWAYGAKLGVPLEEHETLSRK